MVFQCESIAMLTALVPAEGNLAVLYSSNAHGSGQCIYRFENNCNKLPNGGTVLECQKGGRWLLCHNGTVDFKAFGICDEATPADDALDAMLQDDSITCITASNALNFTRRHKFYKSNIRLDFQNNAVTAIGIEKAKHNDPFGAIMHFCGECGESLTHTLTHDMNEQFDIFEVPSSANFSVGSWWRVCVNNLAGREEKEIDLLLCVTEIIDSAHVRFNYKAGWPLAAGRILSFTQISPVFDVEICNMRFCGNIGGEETGAQPVALEFAVRCNVKNVRAKYTYWPVLLRRHNTEYVTEQCSLENPIEVIVGGTGYLTQQIHCLYGHVRDCTCSNARHLNDFTQSAYCTVHNCHGDGDFHGAFVTHGQFEHDLLYIGNSGLLSFANSGPTWGSSAKRITVERHVGCWAIGFAKISDLTLRDVAIHKTEKYEQCGTFLMNADGLQLYGCTGDELVLTQRSRRSRRPNIIQGCHFKNGISITHEGEAALVPNTVLICESNTEGNYE